METLFNGYTLDIVPGGFPLSTDSMALAEFVRLPRKARVLDLGAGCGTLGMLLCAKDGGCTVTGIELEENAHQAAVKNALDNGIQGRLKSICGDLTEITGLCAPGSFDVCVSNPPYFTAGPVSTATPLARHERSCSLEALMRAAAWAVRYGGDFYLVHKPERLAEIFAAACAVRLEPKRLQLLRHREGGPVTLVLVQCRKGGKPGLIWEEAALFREDGQPTKYYQAMYHI